MDIRPVSLDKAAKLFEKQLKETYEIDTSKYTAIELDQISSMFQVIVLQKRQTALYERIIKALRLRRGL